MHTSTYIGHQGAKYVIIVLLYHIGILHYAIVIAILVERYSAKIRHSVLFV